MNVSRFPLIALASLLPVLSARADLNNGLVAYYDFEASGAAGITNRVGGGSTHNGSYGSGNTSAVTPAIAGSGAGFTGDTAYAGIDSTSATDRSARLVGNALNIAKDDTSATAGSGWFNVPTLNTATVGSNFAISAWFYLAQDADNTGTTNDILRDYVFESGDSYDVSFGTNDANGTTFVSWIGETSGAQNAGTLLEGRWHHVVHVFSQDGANTTLSVYVNGTKIGATVSTATTNLNFASLNFGAARTGIRVFDGMLDEVAVWNRSLTANDVTELYLRGQASLALNADLTAAGKAFVRVDPSDFAMGQTSGTGLYDLDEEITVGAFPGLGHVLNGWAAPFNSQTEDSFIHIVTGSVTITANFSRDTADDDGDGLTNYEELVVHQTFADDPDSDDDQINDRDEILETKTDPLVSQLDAVNYIIESLGNGVDPGATLLTRNATNNTLTMKLKAEASTTVASAGWTNLTPASSGVTPGPSNGDFRLQVPGTGDTKRFFRMEGVQP